MTLRFLLAAAALALLASPAIAQVADGTPPPAPIAGESLPLESPRSAPTGGPAGTLGGSGDTGLDSVGILPQRDTDFDRKTWRDTPFGDVLRLLAALPDRIDSAAEHQLVRNLLVSIADAPPGDDGGEKMLTLRVQKLLAMGDVEDAAMLARAAPGAPRDPALAHAEIDAELLAGQIEAACIDIRALGPIIQEDWVATALSLCRYHAGETIEGGIPTEGLGPLGRINGLPMLADITTAPPAQLTAMARDPKLAPDQRVEAAFAAGRASAITGEALAQIFRSVPTPEGLLPDDKPPMSGMEAASLFHAIEAEPDPAMKVALATRGLLSPMGTLDKVSVALAAPLRDVQTTPDAIAAAPRFALYFYALGDIDAAAPWADLAAQAGMSATLWPYEVLLKRADSLGFGEWEQASGLDKAHVARIRTILSVFGVTNPPGPREAVAGENRPEPPLGDLLALDDAALNLRTGETVLRAAALLGGGGAARAHPLALRRALSGLDRVSLHGEAQHLAFEAIAATLQGH